MTLKALAASPTTLAHGTRACPAVSALVSGGMSLSRNQAHPSAAIKPVHGKHAPNESTSGSGPTRPHPSTWHQVLGGAALWAALLFLWTGSPGLAAGEAIRAFCIDFNWGPGGPNGFAPPGFGPMPTRSNTSPGMPGSALTSSRPLPFPAMAMPGTRAGRSRPNRAFAMTSPPSW